MNTWTALLVAIGVTIASPLTATAEVGVAPTASIGLFAEFGDEAGVGGGFVLWLGGTLYPDVTADSEDIAGFISAGVELRTGMIPFLTGPNEVSPQLRFGIAWPGGAEFSPDTFSTPNNLTITRLKVHAIVGYRWAFEFGLDNGDRRRRNEQAVRLGLGLVAPAFTELTDGFPLPNGFDLIMDVNHDGSIDRFGFDLVLGF